MRKIKDNAGQTWSLKVDCWTVRRVHEETGVLLTHIFDDKLALYVQLHDDPIACTAVLWTMVEDQRGDMTEQEFFQKWSADAFEAARKALVEETIDFFGDPASRRELRRVIAKIKNAEAMIKATAAQQANQAIAPLTASQSGKRPTSWRRLRGWIPGATRTANYN